MHLGLPEHARTSLVQELNSPDGSNVFKLSLLPSTMTSNIALTSCFDVSNVIDWYVTGLVIRVVFTFQMTSKKCPEQSWRNSTSPTSKSHLT